MEVRFNNGYVLLLTHLPDRKKPIMELTLGGVYIGHAVFKDEGSFDAFKQLFEMLEEGYSK